MKRVFVYFFAILACCMLAVFVGSELLTQYEMLATGQQRHELGEDLGFGILLFIGLVPELLIGVLVGAYVGKHINSKISVI